MISLHQICNFHSQKLFNYTVRVYEGQMRIAIHFAIQPPNPTHLSLQAIESLIFLIQSYSNLNLMKYRITSIFKLIIGDASSNIINLLSFTKLIFYYAPSAFKNMSSSHVLWISSHIWLVPGWLTF